MATRRPSLTRRLHSIEATRRRLMTWLRLGLPLLLLTQTLTSLSLEVRFDSVEPIVALSATLAFAVVWPRTSPSTPPRARSMAVMCALAAALTVALLEPSGAAWVVGCLATVVDVDQDAARLNPTQESRRGRRGRRAQVLGAWSAFVIVSLINRSPWEGWQGASEVLGVTWFGALTLLRLAGVVGLVGEAEQTTVRNAILTERSALARELHDILAHTLSSLSIDLEGSRLLAVHQGVSADLQQRLDRAGRLARSGLVEAKGALSALRDGQLPGPEGLADLVEGFRSHTGIPCRLIGSGDPRPLSPEARVAVFRTAQEALTNAARHADALHVDVTLDWLKDLVVLTVVDRGAEPVGVTAEGSGLRGMRERAELAGGRLVAGPAPDGFRVELSMPL